MRKKMIAGVATVATLLYCTARLSGPSHACWSHGADSVRVPWGFWWSRDAGSPGILWPELEPSK